jgi:hypothetical protein
MAENGAPPHAGQPWMALLEATSREAPGKLSCWDKTRKCQAKYPMTVRKK